MLEWSQVQMVDGLKLRLVASTSGIRAIDFDVSRPAAGERNDQNRLLAEASEQLHAYFAGLLREFRLPLDMRGTDFQMCVWKHLLAIPYGDTRSYLNIAEAVGSPRAVRAVGATNGANPIPIVVPCHRVVGSNGSLTGFGGGINVKRWLLDHEARIAGQRLF